ncbi:hypothetical protein T01_5584 [Trichinella spiralis]|uniref:Uncharacterized protein n=1 Tax=Trichinella spiralis TaxID=6334 RepID=A0A0V1BYU8_TRISP|nr:hypothetical protein T01_5584 [Trichinella spiralis]
MQNETFRKREQQKDDEVKDNGLWKDIDQCHGGSQYPLAMHPPPTACVKGLKFLELNLNRVCSKTQ